VLVDDDGGAAQRPAEDGRGVACELRVACVERLVDGVAPQVESAPAAATPAGALSSRSSRSPAP